MKKRLFSNLFFVAVMAFLCLALTITSSAAYSGTCGAEGDNLTWYIDTDTGTLIIEGEGDMADFTEGTPWNSSLFNKVEIRSGVTSIGEKAFIFIDNIKIGPDVSKLDFSAFDYDISNIEIDPDNDYFLYKDGAIYSKDMTTLVVAFQKMEGRNSGVYIPEGVVTLAKGSLVKSYNADNNSIYLPSTIENMTAESFISRDHTNADRCTPFGTIYLHENNKNFEADGNAIYNKDKTILIISNGGDIADTVEEIGDYAFYARSFLSRVVIPDSVRKIGAYNIREATLSGLDRKKFIPDTVILLEKDAICSSCLIYYEGSEEQWNELYPYDTRAEIIFNHTHSFTTEQIGCRYYKTCSGCDVQVFDYDEHDWYYDHSTEDATYYSCYNCPHEKVEPKEANEHVWENISSGNRQNCEEPETSYFRCELSCGKYKTETLEPTKHNWFLDEMLGNSYIEDCTQGGELHYYCYGCSEEKIVTVEPKEHDWYIDEMMSALYDCTQGGELYYNCHNCQNFKTEIVEPKEHTIYWKSNNDATCTKDGTKSSYCSECTISDWKPIETVTDEGSALGHDHSGEWTVLLPATCTDRGVQIKNCQRCLNSIISEAIPAKEHVDADDNKVCDECSTKLSDTTVPDDTNPDEGTTETPDEPEEPKKEANVFSFLTEFLNSIIDFFKKLFKL